MEYENKTLALNWHRAFEPELGEVFQRQGYRRLTFLLIGYMDPIQPGLLEQMLFRCRQNIDLMRCAQSAVQMQRRRLVVLRDGKLTLTRSGRRRYEKLLGKLVRAVRKK